MAKGSSKDAGSTGGRRSTPFIERRPAVGRLLLVTCLLSTSSIGCPSPDSAAPSDAGVHDANDSGVNPDAFGDADADVDGDDPRDVEAPSDADEAADSEPRDAAAPDAETAVRCDPSTFSIRCEGVVWVECQPRGDVHYEARFTCPPGRTCKLHPDGEHWGCVDPAAEPCYGDIVARCVDGTAFSCTDFAPFEFVEDCVALGRECDIGSSYDGDHATCKQPGAEACPYSAWGCPSQGCDGDRLLDCCGGFLERSSCPDPGQVCVVSTRPDDEGGRICLPPDYEVCDATVTIGSCDGSEAVNCYNYVERVPCIEPNPVCVVHRDEAMCSFEDGVPCMPGFDSDKTCLDFDTDVVCSDDGYEQLVLCAEGCECLGYHCVEETPDGPVEICE